MNLGSLLIRLKPLLAEPEANWDELVEVLASHRAMAEYEVARFYALQAVESQAMKLLEAPDPAERKRGIEVITATFPRGVGGKLLRHMIKDPDMSVRSSAREAVNTLGINDVALPNTRASYRGHRQRFDGFGWYFGVDKQKPKRPKIKPKLPKLKDTDALAKLVGHDSANDLKRFIRPGTATGAPYVEFEIPKRSGGTRAIAAPRAPLKAIQRTLLHEILEKIPAHEAAHGFVRGRSIVTNAAPHEGAHLVVKMDLKNFFPSIHFRRVEGLFQYYGYGREVARMLAALMTHRPVIKGKVIWPGLVPQGAPTSPALANIVCRRLDSRLGGFAKQVGGTYTRYADDLTFSFAEEPKQGLGHFLWWVDQVCGQEGFVENIGKRRILRPCGQQRVTGIVVNSGLHVPRAARRRFRAILHNCRQKGIASQTGGKPVEQFRQYLTGFAGYVAMVQPDIGKQLVAEVAELLSNEG